MEVQLKEQLISAMLRLRRLGLTFPPDLDIRMGEFFLLKAIARDEQCPDGNVHLAETHCHLHITKPAVSQMLNALENKNYIRREIDRGDRRRISVRLTPEGMRVLARAKEYMDQIMDRTTSRFGEGNTQQLVTLLHQLADVSEQIGKETSQENQKGDHQLD